MITETAPHQANLTPPPGFQFDPDLLDDYEEQVQNAIAHAKYQEAPLPTFEGVPTVDVQPKFNPTGAPESEIYARGRVSEGLRHIGSKPRSEWVNSTEPVKMWRIVERSKLEDGTGLVASRVLQQNSLGDVEGFDPVKHLASHDAGRMNDPEAATPFVSFATDPQYLASNMIVRTGFGIRDGRDSVVVQVEVDPSRVITGSDAKEPEVLLLGGVAPDEYTAAYSVADFIQNAMPNQEVRTIHGDTVTRDQAIGHWALPAIIEPPDLK
jgi:hypothetical protein